MYCCILIEPKNVLNAQTVIKSLRATGVEYKYLNRWRLISVLCDKKITALMVKTVFIDAFHGMIYTPDIVKRNKYVWPE